MGGIGSYRPGISGVVGGIGLLDSRAEGWVLWKWLPAKWKWLPFAGAFKSRSGMGLAP